MWQGTKVSAPYQGPWALWCRWKTSPHSCPCTLPSGLPSVGTQLDGGHVDPLLTPGVSPLALASVEGGGARASCCWKCLEWAVCFREDLGLCGQLNPKGPWSAGGAE